MRCTRVAIVGVLSALLSGSVWPAAASAQNAGHVSVLPIDPSAYVPNAWSARAAAAKSFYATHRDAYDFLILFPAFPVDLSKQGRGEVLGTHWPVRNDVTGIGIGQLDIGSEFGSSARLKAVIDVHSLVPGIEQGGFDAAIATVAHEVAHQWAAHVAFRDRRTGQVSSALLGNEGAHWSFFLDSDASVMYGSDWRDAGAGRFVADASRKRYSALDLYLMGFLGKEEVPPFSLLEPGPGAPTDPTALPPVDGTSIAGTAVQVTVQDVIAAEGPRVPDVATSQKIFRAAFAIAVPEGVDPTPAQLAFVDSVRREWANRFFFMTRGRAVMETELLEAPPRQAAPDPSTAAGLAWLLAAQQGDGTWRDADDAPVRATAAAVQALALCAADARVPPAIALGADALEVAVAAPADFAARRALGLAAAGRIRPVAVAARNGDGGVGPAAGYGSTVVDTVLVALARHAAGGAATDLDAALEFLRATQNGDGGWPWTPGGPSRVEPTAWVLQLIGAERSDDLLWNVSRVAAVEYLKFGATTYGFVADEGFTSASVLAEAVLALDVWDGQGDIRSGPLSALPESTLLASQQPDGSWAGSAYQTALAVRALRRIYTPNLYVLPQEIALSSASVIDGEPVRVHLRIQSAGRGVVENLAVRLADSNGVAYGPDVVIPKLSAGGFTDLEVVVDTTGHAGAQQLFVVVDPAGLVDETTRADNAATVALVVSQRPAGPELLAVAGSVVLFPPAITRFPAELVVTTTVGNLGGTGAGGIEIALEAAGGTLATTVVDLPAGTLRNVALVGTIAFSGAPVPVTVRVDPRDLVAEPREDNNAATAILGIAQTVDVSVARVSAPGGTIELGRDIDVQYVLRNDGTIAADSTVVTVTVVDGAGGIVATLAPVALTVAPAQELGASVRWHADRAGTFTFRVVAKHPKDENPANDEGAASVTVAPSTTPNLIVQGGITVSPDPMLATSPGEIRFAVANVGGGSAGPSHADVQVSEVGKPPSVLATLEVPPLASGATSSLTVPWTPPTAVSWAIQVRADSAGEVTEFSEDDNAAARTVVPRPIGDLVIEDGNIVASNPMPRPGEIVWLTVSTYNAGGQPVGPVALELFLGDPDAGGAPLGSSTVTVAAGESASAQFRWDTAGLAGPQQLVARVNATHSRPEQSYANNSGTRQVVVQQGAVAISEAFFSPNGDGVKDVTELTYRLASAAPVEVRIARASDGVVVRKLPSAVATSGAVTWDGRTDGWKIADDDDYLATVVASTGAGETTLGTAKIVLDTNRIPLDDVKDAALVRESEIYNRFGTGAAEQREPYIVGITRDERGAIVFADATSLGCGIFRVPLAAGSPQRLPTAWPPASYHYNADTPCHVATRSSNYIYDAASNKRWALTRDDRWVAFSGYDSYSGYHYIAATKLETGEYRQLLPGLTTWGFADVQEAPDGRLWGAPLRQAQSSRYQRNGWGWDEEVTYSYGAADSIRSVDLAGNALVEVEHATNDIIQFQLSPDGTRIAMQLFDPIPANFRSRVVLLDRATGVETTLQELPNSIYVGGSTRWAMRWTPDSSRLVLSTYYEGLAVLDAATGAMVAQPRPGGELNGFAVGSERDVVLFGQGETIAGTELSLVYGASPAGASPKKVPFSRPVLDTYYHRPLRVDGVSPGATVAWLYDDYGGGHVSALQNLGNGFASIRGSRPVGGTGIRFDGIAADAHFESFTVAVRAYRSTNEPVLIRRGLAPVVDGELASWVPPGPGLYEATLTVVDKAGNVVEGSTVVGWSSTPAIANLVAEPPIFSPNGDGLVDETVVRYTVVLPGETDFKFTDPWGRLVRTIHRTDTEPGPSSFVWDGRNDAGVVVGDGTYRVDGHGVSQLIEVDRTPPHAELFADARLIEGTKKGGRWGPPGHQSCPECRLVPWSEVATAPDGSPSGFWGEAGWMSWSAGDKNLARYDVEVAAAGSSAFAPLFQNPVGIDAALPVRELRGATFRVSARDTAGNVSYTAPAAFPEKIVLTGVGDAIAFDPAASGLLLHEGQAVPRLDLLDPVLAWDYSGHLGTSGALLVPRIPSPLPFEPKPYALSFATTVGAPLVSWSVSYTLDGVTIEDFANVTMVAESAIVWDASAMPRRPFHAVFRAKDANGRVFEEGVDFRVAATLSGCVSVDDRDGTPKELLELEAAVAFANPTTDRLAPGATLKFTRTGQPGPELVYPVTVNSPTLDQSTFRYSFGVDTRSLTSCEYLVELEGTTEGGDVVLGHLRAQLCGLQPFGVAISNGPTVRVPLFETYRPALSRIDWKARSAADKDWTAAGSVPPFNGYGEAPIPWPGCPVPMLELTAVLPPGQSVGDTPFRACRPAQYGNLPCGRVSVEVKDVTPGVPRCVANSRTYEVKAGWQTMTPWLLGRTELWLESSGGSQVADITLPAFAPSSSGQRTTTVSTTALAEDVLTVKGKFWFGAPNTSLGMGAQVAADTKVIVDHTPPAMAIRSPADGQHLCPVPVAQGDGTTRKMIPLDLVVTDEWLGSVDVWVRPVDGAWTQHRVFAKFGVGGIACELRGPEAGPQTLAGRSYLDASLVPPGAYDLMLDGRDCSLGSTCSAPRRFHVDEHATFQNVALTPSLAAPDLDVLHLLFSVAGAGTLTASAQDALGTSHELFEVQATPGPSDLAWDGTAAGGVPLRDGDYRVVLDLRDSCGGYDTRVTTVSLDRTPPGVQIAAPAAGATVGASVVVSGAVTDAHLQAWTLTAAPAGSPDAVRTLAQGTEPVTGILGSFSTSGLGEGDWVLRLSAVDALGHTAEAVSGFRVVPTQLLSGFAVSPALISPNGDGTLDAATAVVSLLAPAMLDVVVLDGAGATRWTIARAVYAGAGATTYPLDAGLLTPLADGDFVVRVTAANAAVTEIETAPLVVDTLRPSVEPALPAANAWVKGSTPIAAAISDLHLASWTASLRSAAGTRPLASGRAAASGTLASSGALADGDYTVVLHAGDAGGNLRDVEVPFRSDATPPELRVASPDPNAFLSGVNGPAQVSATITEANLATAVVTADTATGLHEIWRGTSQGPIAFSWNVLAETDGPAVLKLSASDLAGNARDLSVPIVLDSTPPAAEITSPHESFVTGAPLVTGTATDANLESWRLELAFGPPTAGAAWFQVGGGTGGVNGGVLADLVTRPADGLYSLRLTVLDRAANRTEALASFTVDTVAPRPALDLVADVQGANDVALSWTASPDPDVVGYKILRGPTAATLSPLPGVVAGTTTVLHATPDGSWTFAVIAVDGAALESARSNTATVEIDTSMPRASIAKPVAGARVRADVAVEGTASSPKGFLEYRLGAGVGATPPTFTPLASGTAPVPYGTLGHLDTRAYADGTVLTLRVEAEDLRGHVAEARVTVTVDNAPPAAPVLLSATGDGSTANLTWRANTEPDLAGYLVLRNGTIANAPEGASLDDLTAYLRPLSPTSWSQPSLPDGKYTYQLQAMDKAGNLSPPSNAIDVTIDTRAPSAWIATPADRTRLPGGAVVVAESSDRDLASIRIEARARTDAPFVTLSEPTTFPYAALLDPAAFPDRVVEVRAVATDRTGKRDANPASVFYYFDQPPETPAVSALTDGNVVTLTWTDGNPPGSVAGYRWARAGATPVAGPRPGGIASAGSSAAGRDPQGAYDTDWNTSWLAGHAGPERWQLDLVVPTVVEKVSANAYVNLDVWVKVRGLWMPVARQVYAGSYTLPAPLEIEAVAFEYTQPTGTFGISNVEVTTAPLVQSPAVDPNGTSYNRDYTVAATTPFGLTAAGKVTATFVSISAYTSSAVVRAPQAYVYGYTSPGAVVRVSSGGAVVGSTTATSTSFGLNVPLALGANALDVRAEDAAGNRSAPVTLNVTYEPLPVVDVFLSLVSVVGPDVSLAFSATGDVDKVTGWRITRASPGSYEQTIATLAQAARTYFDPDRPNGHHVYRVTPRFQVGEGAPSNTVDALVDVPPPPAPADLRVDVPPEADRLVLTWAYNGPGGQGFAIEGADAEAGPFYRWTWSVVQGTTWDDYGATPGVPTFYRVRAMDALGNLGEPSNVASGMLPPLPPVTPRLLSPTSAGKPITITDPTTTIAGIARSGDTIELMQNGRTLGRAVTGSVQVVRTPLPTRLTPDVGECDVSRDGTLVAYLRYDPATWNRTLVAENLVTGSVRTFSLPDGDFWGRPGLSPDGTHVVATGYGAPDWNDRVYVGDLATGELRPLAPADGVPAPGGVYAWSHDSASVAYTSGYYPSSLAIADVATGDFRVAWTEQADYWSAEAVAWTGPAEVAIVASRYWGSTLAVSRIDLATGARTDDFTGSSLELLLETSPDGSLLAFAGAESGWRDDLWVLDLPATGAPRKAVSAAGYVTSLTFSPDGKRIAAIADSNLATFELASGARTDLGYLGWNGYAVLWPSQGVVVVDRNGVPATIEVGGRFEFRDVQLDPGLNLFRAFSLDAANARAAGSDPIEVTLDVAAMPDLATTVMVSPPIAVTGDAANAIVTVRNVGGVASTATVLVVRLLTSDPALDRTSSIPLPAIHPGAAVVAPVPIDLTGLEGQQTVVATADPAHLVPDAERGNNDAVARFVVAGAGVTLDVEAAPLQLGVDGDIAVHASLVNGGPEADVTVRIRLQDAAGVTAVEAPDAAFTPLAHARFVSVDRTLGVGTTLAGGYTLVVEAVSGASVLASKRLAVTIAAEQSVALSIASARASYRAAEGIELTSALRNLSRNAPLEGATIRVEVLDGTGAVRHASAPVAMPMLWAGAEALAATPIAAGTLGAGTYAARAVAEVSGAAVVEATTAFEIVAEPLLAGALAVAAPGDPPTVKAGTPTLVTATLRNVGSGPAVGVTGAVVLLAGDGSELGRFPFDAGDLAPAAAGEQLLSVSTGALPLGTYGLTLVAEYDGRFETLATARFRLADGQPPQLVLLAPAEGSHVRGAVTPRVRATDDASGVAAVRASVAGQVVPFALDAGYPQDGTWSVAISLGPDGPYEVVVSASDAEGNDGLAAPTPTNPIRLNVVSDTTLPVVRIAGVPPDSLLNGPVTPVIEAEDLNLARVDARLGGVPFPGGEIGQDGDHALVATATDKAGNSTTARVAFTIDRTPPSIAIVGVDDGAYLPFDVTPTLVVTDAHLESYSATLDGAPFQEGATLTAERAYVIAVTARDRAGNTSSEERTFTIDKTPPRVEIAGVSDGSLVSGPVIPLVTVEDANLLAAEISLDGSPFVSGSTVSDEGMHHLRAVGLDRAGNRTERSVWFVLDGTPPSIAIAGVVDGEITARDVVPVVTVEDVNLSTWTTTIDGVELPVGGAVTTEGVHVLAVTATDLAGNVATRPLTFEIDRTAPVLWASVEDGATYPDAVRVDFGADDRNLATMSATLDGAPVSSGLSVVDGSHVLVVTARDVAGNEASRTYRFEILSVRYAVEKRIIGRHARVLALLPCDPVEASRVEAFLREALPAVPLATVQTDVDLLVQLRTGVHGVVIVAADDRPISCVPTSVAPPIPPGQLRLRVEKELTEAVFRGAGVVVLREDQSAWPQLVEALGLRFLGQQPAGSVALRPSAVSGAMRLLTSDGVELKLESAHEIGVFESDGRTAAAVHQFGLGAAATVGFDASRAETAADAAALVAGAVAFVTPEAGLFPRGVVAIGIDVTNESRPTTTRVRESLDPSLELVNLLGGGVRLPSGELEWSFDQASGATEHLVYVVRMPSSAGTYPVTTEVANVVAGEARVYGTYDLDLTLARGEVDVLGSAVLLAQAIPSKGADVSNRAKLLKLLADVGANAGATTQDRERAIADLLAAIDEVKLLRTVDRTPLRLAIGELLAAWEARP